MLPSAANSEECGYRWDSLATSPFQRGISASPTNQTLKSEKSLNPLVSQTHLFLENWSWHCWSAWIIVGKTHLGWQKQTFCMQKFKNCPSVSKTVLLYCAELLHTHTSTNPHIIFLAASPTMASKQYLSLWNIVVRETQRKSAVQVYSSISMSWQSCSSPPQEWVSLEQKRIPRRHQTLQEQGQVANFVHNFFWSCTFKSPHILHVQANHL